MKKTAIVFMSCLAMFACDAGEASGSPEQEDAAAMQTESVSSAAASGGTKTAPETSIDPAKVGGVLASYESIRSKLAADDAAVGPAASELAAAAAEAVKAVPGAAKELEAVASAAEALASVGADDIAATRESFGELSRTVVELLVQHSGLREGQHIFECPMASKYKKWVQPAAELANPYMGTQMLGCGGESDWAV